MDIKELVALNATVSGEKAVALHQVATLTASNTALVGEKTALETKVAELTASLATATAATPAELVKTKTDLTAAQDELKLSLAFVRKESDRLAVAAGETKLPEAATFAELTANIEANRVKLSAAYEGGIAQGSTAGSGEQSKTATAKPSAFKMA